MAEMETMRRQKDIPLSCHGLNLLEMLLVVVIISIVSAIAIPAYNKSKEHGLGKEAVANLKLIYAAEHAYRMDHASYVACSCSSAADCNSAGGCNTLLKLNLSTGNWRYSVGAAAGVFDAYANRQAGAYFSCVYRIALASVSGDPVVASGAGTCP